MELKYSRHSVGGSNYHLQFTPKYRKPVFRVRKIRKLTEALFRNKAMKLGVKIEAVEFGPDHVHIFVTNCRKFSVSKLVNHFKGYSSWYIRRELPREVSVFLWEDSFWSDGYFYESVGRITSETIKFYIERQQAKHWLQEDPNFLRNKNNINRQMKLDSYCN